jgi:hypothetical protein
VQGDEGQGEDLEDDAGKQPVVGGGGLGQGAEHVVQGQGETEYDEHLDNAGKKLGDGEFGEGLLAVEVAQFA